MLPGVGPVATTSVLLPVTFGLDSTSAIIMLAGIYHGAQYEMLLGGIGVDINNGTARFTFNISQFNDDLNFAVVAMGMFGLGETIANLERKDTAHQVAGRNRRLGPLRSI